MTKVRIGLLLTLFFWEFLSVAQSRGHTLTTIWATNVSQTAPHPEYPRPTMLRPDFLNINGLWDYAVTFATETNAPKYTNQILVPFPIESDLSGTNRHFVSELQRMWYRRKFTVPKSWSGRRILLHFEASNWETEVWMNGRELGVHRGGYDRFSFDITDALNAPGDQEVVVSVINPAETGFQPRGKQMLHPTPPFFTACSGIWQTVWLEPLPDIFIESLKLVPNIDAGTLRISVKINKQNINEIIQATALDGTNDVGSASGAADKEFAIALPNARLWSPDDPFLYNLRINLLTGKTTNDAVSSYFGMRKISIAKDEHGFFRLMLNNKSHFELGLLDQGYWPDGIYTAPTDEALRHDLQVMKDFGFNMCRKHVKIEPERWYYWCDKLGLLVWQDMPNGDRPASGRQKEITRKPESAHQFEQELEKMISQRGNHPSIVTWVLFNQGWGQYDTARLTKWIKESDPFRLVISASGWNDFGTGDIQSFHKYFNLPFIRNDERRASVIGECGGLGLVVSDHLWGGKTTWNTTFLPDAEHLAAAYDELISGLEEKKEADGLTAAVITQLTDVENELNGFVTYDRVIAKMPVEVVKRINKQVLR